MKLEILVIEDEQILARNIEKYLGRHDYRVSIADTGEQGLELHEAIKPDLILLDMQLPGIDGMEVLKRIRAKDSEVWIILMTAHGNVQVAVDAIKSGANDYLGKPVVLSELKHSIDKLCRQERLKDTLSYINQQQARQGTLDAYIGEDPVILKIKGQIRQLAESESQLHDTQPPAVLITGETGTGKELIAKSVHYEGPRRDAPFVELNCTTLPSHLIESELFGYERGAFTDARQRKLGVVETAEGGSLFLDEIGDIDADLQLKLLRWLEEKKIRRLGGLVDRKVDVRVIAATNQPLEQLVEAGKFRSDLYYRLRIIHFHLPPLRERRGDILPLANHFLREFSGKYSRAALYFSEPAQAALLEHDWPGNIRELRNVIERAVLMARQPELTPESLSLTRIEAYAQPADVPATEASGEYGIAIPDEGLNLEDVERMLIEQALDKTDWNVSKAAKLLGLSRDATRYRIKRFGLKREKRA